MNNIQIALMKKYANEKNINKIREISPGAKIAIFDIRKRYRAFNLLREVLRRILPFEIYRLLPHKFEELSDQQRLVWSSPPVNSSHVDTVLLFPPGIQEKVAEELEYTLNPKWIHSIPTGIDRLPSIPKSTLVTSSRGLHSFRIAEFTLGLIFALAKNLQAHIRFKEKRIWKSLPSAMVKGSRIGIVGLGSIGLEIAKISKICGMEVWATKRKPISVDFVDRLLPPEALHCLLKAVDYVVLAVPLTSETYHLIGKSKLDMMKSTACLINVCRGAVVDEDCLYHALKHRRIRAACIDVFEGERPLPKNSRFYRLPNILVTNWSAWYSHDAVEQRMDLFIDNLRRFTTGKPLVGLAENSKLMNSKPNSI